MAATRRRIIRNRRYEQSLPRPRVFRDRLDPLAMNDDDLFERYRFRKPTILYFLTKLGDDLVHPTTRNMSLSAVMQILLFLRFLATGASHILVGDSFQVSRSAAGRAIREVATLFCRHFSNFICFPTGEISKKVMEGFRRIAGFPKVLGCIDGTFIRITSPTHHEADYVNRKGFHSLNVQMVCDPNFRITSASINWPGSTHDSRVWKSSVLYRQFERGQHDGILLGDSAYACTRYLMTPYRTPTDGTQERFNDALCKTRVTIEQTYGILKKRFQSLHYGLRTDPNQAAVYIHAAAILHNIGIEKGDIVVARDINTFSDADISQDVQLEDRTDGRLRRDDIARGFFN